MALGLELVERAFEKGADGKHSFVRDKRDLRRHQRWTPVGHATTSGSSAAISAVIPDDQIAAFYNVRPESRGARRRLVSPM